VQLLGAPPNPVKIAFDFPVPPRYNLCINDEGSAAMNNLGTQLFEALGRLSRESLADENKSQEEYLEMLEEETQWQEQF
jgi:hypothetical protein